VDGRETEREKGALFTVLSMQLSTHVYDNRCVERRGDLYPRLLPVPTCAPHSSPSPPTSAQAGGSRRG
jgi:hypothetical protein